MIPKHFVDENLKKAEGSLFYGIPFAEMTRDELIACAVAGWAEQERQRTEHARRLDFLGSIRA